MIKRLGIILLLVLNLQFVFPLNCVRAANFNINFTPRTKSIALINLDTDTPVYLQAADEKMYPASTTKIMTYIIAVEHIIDLDNANVTIKESVLKKLEGTGSSMAGMKAGEVLSMKQLLYCLMIPSGNDAAMVIADFIGGGDINFFVNLMNQKAQELGCAGTHFMNPHGLYDDNHYVTANDLVKITKYALTLPNFLSICSETVSYIRGDGKPPLVTTNSMINKTAKGGYYYYKYARGIKTGHLDESGYCLVSTALYSGYNYLCVALGAPSIDEDGNDIKQDYSMLDSRQIYRWAFTSLDIKSVATVEEPMSEIKVKLSLKGDTVLLCPEKNISAVLPQNVSTSSIEIKVEKPETVNAPVKKGQKIGTAILSYANQEITRVDLVANNDVEKSYILSFFDGLHQIVASKIFIMSIVLLILLLIIYVAMVFIYHKKRIRQQNKRISKH